MTRMTIIPLRCQSGTMGGRGIRAMSALTPIRTPSRLERAWEVASDLAIITAAIWVLPLLFRLARAVIRSLVA
jgi:hypothetical protein